MACFFLELEYRGDPLLFLGGLSDDTGEVYYAFGAIQRFLQCSGEGLTFIGSDQLIVKRGGCGRVKNHFKRQKWVHDVQLIPYLRRLETERSIFLYLFFLLGKVREVESPDAAHVRMYDDPEKSVCYYTFLDDFVTRYGLCKPKPLRPVPDEGVLKKFFDALRVAADSSDVSARTCLTKMRCPICGKTLFDQRDRKEKGFRRKMCCKIERFAEM